ncbi:MAG: hypothetical protein ABIO57_00040 [Candidatus Paceibacterota bacterium]
MRISKKRSGIVIGIIAVIAIGLFFVLKLRHVYFRSPIVFLPEAQQVTTADSKASIEGDNGEYTTLREVSGAGATNSMSRDEALQVYAGRVIQLDTSCRAQPLTTVIPQKSALMFDNESRWQRTIIVGPRTYRIEPFDYVLVSFNDSGTFAVTCDSVQAVALIAVQ